MMISATKEFLQQIDELSEKRKQEILNAADNIKIEGTSYYVSNDGDDENDGLTPTTAWKTLQKVSDADLKAGDGVRFRRGDLFRGMVATKPGVTYCAFGEGPKPKLYGWDENLADPSLWEVVDSEQHIWKYTKKILDSGTLVFNDGEAHSIKLIPSYMHGKFVCRDNESKPFDMREEMVRDLDIYWHFEDIMTEQPSKGESFPVPDVGDKSFGDLYLRCDKGNPGEVFDSIEAVPKRPMFWVRLNPNVKIDNICMKYIGRHAVAAGGRGGVVKGLYVTNCEISWIGGTIQMYFGTDPNYPEGKRGQVTRFGNGVEIYGACDDYEVSNCYLYQIYDAGITHQKTTDGNLITMTNIRYQNNLVEKCVYSVEYFLDMNHGDTESYMGNIEMSGNILRHAGYGWGQQRHNKHTPAHIKGWSYVNQASNYSIHNNIFDRSAYRMLHLVAQKEESCPEMHDNTYIQHLGGMLGQYGGNEIKEPDVLLFDEQADEKIEKIFGDKNAKVYVIK